MSNYVSGNCYYASEALYHILGGAKSGWQPMFISSKYTSNKVTHWYLQHTTGLILDPARLQFKDLKGIPYEHGVRKAFLTKKPSRRGNDMMTVLTWAQSFKTQMEGIPE
jgi:hypothetical protein